MKLSAKNITIFTAIAFTAMSQSFVAAQTATGPTSPISQIETLDTELVDVNAPVSKVTLQSSWAGKKVALRGKDVVSYHKNDKPLKGSKKYVAEYDDTTWRFSSEENRDEFLENHGVFHQRKTAMSFLKTLKNMSRNLAAIVP